MELQNLLVQYRRELHRFPELSMQEHKTTERIKQWLTQAGIAVLDIPNLTVGVVAEVRGNCPGPTIALRADIDALPIQELSGVEFCSEVPGVMHACGHDFHTSVMIGAAILLQENREQLHGSVRFLFQPAEEAANGAKWMAEHDVLNGVSAVFGCHNRPDLPVGTIGVKEGALMASVDRFEIDVNGTGGHAGMPQNCVDPIVIGAQIVTALQTVVSRGVSPIDSAVVSVTRFSAGNTWNVIPTQAQLEGTVRTLQKTVREQIPNRMRSIAEGITQANGAKAEFRWFENLPMVFNAPQFTEVISRSAEQENLNVIPAKPNLGGEDFALYQSLIPGYFVWIGTDGKEEWHHPQFTVNEQALSVGARYFARLGRNVLNQLNTSTEKGKEDKSNAVKTKVS